MKLITRFLVLISTISFISGSEYVTCDFDLVKKEPEILQYLPKYCQDVEEDSDLYAKLIEENKNFDDFNKALEKYERDRDPGATPEEIPNGQWEKRLELYKNAMLMNCSKDDSLSNIEVLDCIIEQRNKMISELNKNNE